MAFNKNSGSKAGQKSSRKGIPNKSTTEIRALFQQLLSNNIERLQGDIEELEPAQRIKALLDMAKYVIPALRSIEYKVEKEESEKTLDWSKLNDEELGFIYNLLKKYA